MLCTCEYECELDSTGLHRPGLNLREKAIPPVKTINEPLNSLSIFISKTVYIVFIILYGANFNNHVVRYRVTFA